MNFTQAKQRAEGKKCLRHPKNIPALDLDYSPLCVPCKRERLEPVWGEYSKQLERSGNVVSTSLATRDQRLAALAVQDVRALIPGLDHCNDSEVKGFILYCKAVNADPWAKEIYLIKYDSKAPAAIALALNWYLKRASHNPAYESYESGIILERQGQYIDLPGSVVYPGDQLFGGWCKVYKKGATKPFERRVSMQEYDKKQAGWNKMPATMIEKVAIMQAVRRAFPDEFGAEPEVGLPVVMEDEVEAPPTIPAPQALSPAVSIDCPLHSSQTFRLVRGRYMHIVDGEQGPRGGKVWCYQDELPEETQEPPQETIQDAPQGPSKAEPVSQEGEAPESPSFKGTRIVDLKNYALDLGYKSWAAALAALGIKDDALIADLEGAASELRRLAGK